MIWQAIIRPFSSSIVASLYAMRASASRGVCNEGDMREAISADNPIA
jgi:hypothetical protein